jgi:hypothetical protein
MSAAVELRTDYSIDELRRLAKGSKDANQSRRLLSLAAVLEGMNRADAARIGIVYEVLKIVRKHPEIHVEELQCLPFAIALGEYRKDARRECCVTIFYNEPIKNTLYIIGVKSACSDGEAWVQSFYRTTPDKSKNKRQHNKLLCKGR